VLEADGKFQFEENEKMGFQSFGAQFCEVKIDPDLPLVRVTRSVSVIDCGRVINLKTRRRAKFLAAWSWASAAWRWKKKLFTIRRLGCLPRAISLIIMCRAR
jgi:hypothetical protein